MRNYFLFIVLLFIDATGNASPFAKDSIIQIVFTADVHYGYVRAHFRGKEQVRAQKVNAAMLQQINRLPPTRLPEDGGVAAGKTIRFIDYLIVGGDIANRAEEGYQNATRSWDEFINAYNTLLSTKSSSNKKTGLLLTPGNHDASNAIGYFKKLHPAVNPDALLGIYNRMMPKPKTKATFDYYRDPVNYSRDIGGIHFLFVSIWPDSSKQQWMDQDIRAAGKKPVLLFTHVPPYGDPKLFYNPHVPPTINAQDKMENLLPEHLKDKDPKTDIIEQREWVVFLKAHPQIKAYFHGHENKNEYYTYTGPDDDIQLPAFRVDSPMKGKRSSKDERQLSFQLLSVNTVTGQLTVRECLWNTDPKSSTPPLQWGAVTTLQLR
ncbi:MAG: metallophosphoesterase [Niabella sp.]|nr:metallophosphoesterase [Niabella sp.]